MSLWIFHKRSRKVLFGTTIALPWTTYSYVGHLNKGFRSLGRLLLSLCLMSTRILSTLSCAPGRSVSLILFSFCDTVHRQVTLAIYWALTLCFHSPFPHGMFPYTDFWMTILVYISSNAGHLDQNLADELSPSELSLIEYFFAYASAPRRWT